MIHVDVVEGGGSDCCMMLGVSVIKEPAALCYHVQCCVLLGICSLIQVVSGNSSVTVCPGS